MIACERFNFKFMNNLVYLYIEQIYFSKMNTNGGVKKLDLIIYPYAHYYIC